MTAPEIEAKTVRVCEACEAAVDPEEEGPALYECGSCGTTFNRDGSADGDSSRCPDCLKFSAKVGDASCPECGEGPLGEEEQRWECPECGELHETEDEARACCASPADDAEEDGDDPDPRGYAPGYGKCAACRRPAAGDAVRDPSRAEDYPRPEPSRCWAHQPRYAPVLRHSYATFMIPRGTHWNFVDTYSTPLQIGAARHASSAMEDYRGKGGCIRHDGAAWEAWVVLDGWERNPETKQPMRVAREWIAPAAEVGARS